jgi:hypothetical protein
MKRMQTFGAIAAGALFSLGLAGGAAAQDGVPTVDDLTASIFADVANTISISGGGDSSAVGGVTTGNDGGIVSADGGNSVALGDDQGAVGQGNGATAGGGGD